jgi:hypothetical protein
MAHLTTIGAGMFSDLSVCTDMTASTGANVVAIATPTEANLKACFAAGKYTRIRNVREFPSVGTPANIVNVPAYGQKTSSQVQGQADSPTLEMTLNYVANDWSSTSTLGLMVGDQVQRVFRFTVLNELPGGFDSSNTNTANSIAGMTANPVENTSYYFIGKVEALLINPQLTDANTATLTLSVQSDFFGAYTIT